MGFKKVNTTPATSEETFINPARGDTSEAQKPKHLKRDMSVVL